MSYEKYFMSYLSCKDVFIILLNVTLTVAAALLLYRTNSTINHWSVELRKKTNACVEELHQMAVPLFSRQKSTCPLSIQTLRVKRLKKNVIKGKLPQRNARSGKKGCTYRIESQSRNDLLQNETCLRRTSSSCTENMTVLQDTWSDSQGLDEMPNITEHQVITTKSSTDCIKYDCLPSAEPVNAVESQYTDSHLLVGNMQYLTSTESYEQEQSCQNLPTAPERSWSRDLHSRQNLNRDNENTFVKSVESISMSLTKIHSSTVACASTGLCDMDDDLCAGKENDNEDKNRLHMHNDLYTQGETAAIHFSFQVNSTHFQNNQKEEQIEQQKVTLNQVGLGSISSASSETNEVNLANGKYQEQRCDQMADYSEYVAVVNVQNGEKNVPFQKEGGCKTKCNCYNENVHYSEQDSNIAHRSENGDLTDPVNDNQGLLQPSLSRDCNAKDGDKCEPHGLEEIAAKCRISAEESTIVTYGKSEEEMNNSIEEDGDLSNYDSSGCSKTFGSRQTNYNYNQTNLMAQKASSEPNCQSEDETTVPKSVMLSPLLTGNQPAGGLTLECQQHSQDLGRPIPVVQNTNASAVTQYTYATDTVDGFAEPMLQNGTIKNGSRLAVCVAKNEKEERRSLKTQFCGHCENEQCTMNKNQVSIRSEESTILREDVNTRDVENISFASDKVNKSVSYVNEDGQTYALPHTGISSRSGLVESVEKHSYTMHENICQSDLSQNSAVDETSPKTLSGTLNVVKRRPQWEGSGSNITNCVTSESHLDKQEVENTFGVNLRIDDHYPLTFQDIPIEKMPSLNSDHGTYNWTNLISDELQYLGDAMEGFEFWMSSNRPIYEQLKQIRWVMGYFSSGNSIDVFVDLDGMDPGFYLDELCRITEQPPSKFHIKDNNHQWSL